MNIVLHSEAGDTLGLALRLQDEGHAVGMYIHEPESQMVGTGLVYHVTDFLKACDAADLVLFDYVGAQSLADKLRDDGCAVFGAGKFQDVLELDRIRGIRLMQAAGLRVPETEFFEDASFERAMDFVRKDGGRWVFKASGNIGADKSFPSDDAEQMLDYLEHLDDTIQVEEARRPKFILQRFVEGVEVSTERIYSEGRPIHAFDNSTFETKKFLAGDLGQAVGCSGNVVCPHADRRLLAETVDHLDKLAAIHGVTSCLDLNAIVAKDDGHAYVLEATGRVGIYAIHAFCALWGMPLGETFYDLATGREPEVTYRAAWGAAIPVSMAPYPAKMEHERGTPVVDEILDDPQIWPLDVMVDEQDRVVVAGVDGVIYVVTGVGDTISESLGQCYRWLEGARMPDRGWRVDLIETLEKRYRKLQQLGYLREARRAA